MDNKTLKLENLNTSEKRVLFYLVHFDVFDRLDIMKHSYWTKFSERLGELERKLGYEIAIRKRKEITNVFGSKISVMTYQAIDKESLADVFGGKYQMFLHMANLKQPHKTKIQEKETIDIERPEMQRESFLN